jgi:nucleoside-diphosphate-sugar epimerase
MSDLAFLCREIANSDVKVVYRSSEDKEYVTDNPNRRCPNISKAKSLLAYAPKVDLRDGLLMYYNHYKLMS